MAEQILRSLAFKRDDLLEDQWPVLSCSAAKELHVDRKIKTTDLQSSGTVQALTFQGDGSSLTGIVKKTGDTMTGALTVQNNLSVTGIVGIGTATPSEKLEVAGKVKASALETSGLVGSAGGFQVDGKQVIDANAGWHRTYGNTGWRNNTHGGGWYMSDANWIRSYGDKSVYHNIGILRTDGTLQVGPDGNRFLVNASGNVGIGTATPQDKLDVDGSLRFNGKANRRVYGALRAGSDAVILDGHWDELEVKGRVIDWTGSNLHIGFQNDHSEHGLYIGNGKLKTVAIQGNTSLTIGGNVGIGTIAPPR